MWCMRARRLLYLPVSAGCPFADIYTTHTHITFGRPHTKRDTKTTYIPAVVLRSTHIMMCLAVRHSIVHVHHVSYVLCTPSSTYRYGRSLALPLAEIHEQPSPANRDPREPTRACEPQDMKKTAAHHQAILLPTTLLLHIYSSSLHALRKRTIRGV